jgi:hypothetical protein
VRRRTIKQQRALTLAVAVPVRLVDHLLQLLVRHVFAQLLGDALQILEADLALAREVTVSL